MIPVVWWNLAPEAPARGPYWDRGLLEDLLAGAVWRVPGAPEFEHYEGASNVSTFANERGGVMVVPARQNVDSGAQLQWAIDHQPWTLLVLTGDEADEFNWRELVHPDMRVWKMGGKVAAMDGCDQPLGSGYPPWFRALMPSEAPTKRDLAYNLHDTIADLQGRETDVFMFSAPAEMVTAIIPTSPSPIHPSIEHIAATVGSVRASLGDCEIVIAIDGVRPEMQHRADDYHEYTRRLLWACNHQWHNVVPVMLDEWGHQANAARKALELVRTPLVLFVEHDCPLVGEIDWPGLCSVVADGTANMIRLHHEASILAPHRHLMVGERRAVRGVPLWGTVQWSQRPHLARADWYRRMLDVYFGTQSRTMIEDVMHGVLQHAWNVAGHVGWEQWRTWIYAPDGDVKRSEHLDSRGDDDKFDMMFRYEGDVPEGAPQPN